MQPTESGRRLAINAVLAAMRAKRLYDATDLAAAAAVDPDTVRDFLAAKRWPRVGTFTKFEQALGMPAGEISALAAEDASFVDTHAAAGASAKTLEAASEVELLIELLNRATARLGDS